MESTTRLHPLLTAAAVSVIVLSAAGVAAITGILPVSVGSTRTADPVSVASAPAAAPFAPTVAAPAPVAAQPIAQAPAAKPKPVKKAPLRTAAVERENARENEREREYDRERGIDRDRAPVVLAQAPAPARPVCRDCGTIESVREIEEKGKGSWMGPVAGGVGGAILGKQMGKGDGNTIMTILGAAGGAYAGHEVEKRVRTTKRWDVSVRLDDGSLQSMTYNTAPAWRAGERVRLANGTITLEPRAVN